MNLWRTPLLGQAIFSLWKVDARRKLGWIKDWIKPGDTLVDIGSGPGSTLNVMRGAGYHIEGLDIRDSAYRPDLKARLYPGDIFPYADQQFDTALLLTMLHHTPEPETIISEAVRCAKRVIIIEDVYDNAFQAWYTKRTDSLTNLEFIGHPHSNRSHIEWLETFETMDLTLRYSKVHPLALIYQQVVYVLDVG